MLPASFISKLLSEVGRWRCLRVTSALATAARRRHPPPPAPARPRPPPLPVLRRDPFLSRFDQPVHYKDVVVDCATIEGEAGCADKATCSDAICEANSISTGCRGYTCQGAPYDPDVRIRAASSRAERAAAKRLSRARASPSLQCAVGTCKLFYYPKEEDYHFL